MVTLIVIGVSINAKTRAPLLLLYPLGSQKLLCLPIDPMEAFTVSKALHGFGETGDYATSFFSTDAERHTEQKNVSREEEVLKRSLVHDFTLEVINNLGGRLQTVSLIPAEEDFYSAEVNVEGAEGIFTLRCRPADAIALALRANVPILTAASFIAHAENLSDVMDSLPEYIQKAINTTLAAESPLLMALGSEKNGGITKELLDNPSLESVKQLALLLEKNKTPRDSTQALLPSPLLTEKDTKNYIKTLGVLSDAEQWTELLFSLTPETKKTM